MQPHGHRRRLEPPLQLYVTHGAFFETQRRIDISPATFSPKNVALGIRARHASKLLSFGPIILKIFEAHRWYSPSGQQKAS